MRAPLSPEELGRELRHGTGLFLEQRRKIVKLTFFSSSILGVIALYQMGILKRLPPPPSGLFDAEKVNGSAQAYSILNLPDAYLGLASYAATACLAGMGAGDRWKTHPLIPISMGLKALADATLAGKLTLDECTKFRTFSVWSVLTAGATFAVLPLAIPEARAALRHLLGKNERNVKAI